MLDVSLGLEVWTYAIYNLGCYRYSLIAVRPKLNMNTLTTNLKRIAKISKSPVVFDKVFRNQTSLVLSLFMCITISQGTCRLLNLRGNL